MSSTNYPAPSTKDAKDMKKLQNPALTLHILEMVLTQYLFPECTWDSVEECVGWCRAVIVDPAPLRRIGREWMKRATGIRTLLEALFVRSNPKKFCCGIVGVPHAITIVLGETIERDQDWRTEVRSQDPGVVLVESRDFPVHIWWVSQCVRGAKWIVQRTIEEELPAWCSVVGKPIRTAINGLYHDIKSLWII